MTGMTGRAGGEAGDGHADVGVELEGLGLVGAEVRLGGPLQRHQHRGGARLRKAPEGIWYWWGHRNRHTRKMPYAMPRRRGRREHKGWSHTEN